MSGKMREAEPVTSKVKVERARPSMSIETGTRIPLSKDKDRTAPMHLSAIDCDHFKPSHQNHDAKPLDRSSVSSNEVDTCFSHRRRCPADDAVARTERTLASFHAAVARDYGPEEAEKAAEDWIEELGKTGADEHPDWRSVTAPAAHRLALRMVERHAYLLK
jgi:hypothetical protein